MPTVFDEIVLNILRLESKEEQMYISVVHNIYYNQGSFQI